MRPISERRLSSRQRGYTPIWDKLSRLYRGQHPLCCGCEAMGLVEPATVVDHIEPHQGNQLKFWDQENNWQSACDWHHNAVKPKLERMWLDGAITLAELRLNSPIAIEIAKRTPRRNTIAMTGVDGW